MTAALITALVLLAVATYLWRRATAELSDSRALTQQQETALADAQGEFALLSACLSGAHDGLIVVDEQGAIVANNPAACEMLGLAADDHAGSVLVELVPWPRLHEALVVLRRDGVPQSFELDTGSPVARSLRVQVSMLPGLGAMVCIEDQSLLKRLESLRREFVANVSHELKTPLAAIKGFVETMLDDPDMSIDTQRRFMERVRQQSDRLATLVSDLLTLSRLDDDPGMQTADPSDLQVVLADTLRDLMPIAEQREITLDTSFPEGAVWVRADGEALRQMAGNLVDNALKYTPERGTVTIRLTTLPGRSRLEVADTGIGLSPGDQDRIFERFYRVDRARSRELGGTGLGLSIVKNTALSLGGDIGVSSELGVGSMFWVELPIVT